MQAAGKLFSQPRRLVHYCMPEALHIANRSCLNASWACFPFCISHATCVGRAVLARSQPVGDVLDSHVVFSHRVGQCQMSTQEFQMRVEIG